MLEMHACSDLIRWNPHWEAYLESRNNTWSNYTSMTCPCLVLDYDINMTNWLYSMVALMQVTSCLKILDILVMLGAKRYG